MQDKEFDQLFKDRFEDAEVQPSANLWGNIAEELEPQRKRSLPVYWWSAAAVVLVTLGIGLLSPKTERIRLQSAGEVAGRVVPGTDALANAVRDAAVAKVAGQDDAEKIDRSTPLVIAPRLSAADEKNNLTAMQPNRRIVHPDDKPQETITPVNELTKENIPANNVMIANADLPAENSADAISGTAPQEHRGIRNVGDLVNFVVNKVDKRENKLVQFDTDDDNSSLVSLNLGIIRFSKRSNK
ncbi:MAG TPA: hypothetical protein VK541_12675 [Pedobacter sp.]|uniref:hypothetical protein n=1 Tax=Pedobacter sp. TaxID=1411316 RepID=UPI002BAD4548|nr:hypothetical protein [Pedobacter sp.]HMI03336.1 hypothetical protein [Pedobacter sp.]